MSLPRWLVMPATNLYTSRDPERGNLSLDMLPETRKTAYAHMLHHNGKMTTPFIKIMYKNTY